MKTRLIATGIGCTSILLLIFLLASPRLFSQTNTTSLSGTVTDATGAIIPGATVSISNAASGTTQSTQTKSNGGFSFEQVQPGTYEVKVTMAGFSGQTEKVELLVSTPVKLSFKLNAGATDVVTVETNQAEVNTSDATLGKAFDTRQVQNLPYLANNVTYLLSLQPGVLALDSGAQTGGLNQDTRTGIVNGARQDQTNITLDGVDNNDQIFGYAFNGALRSTRDSVEEFRVTTTNANADAGRSSGAQVSLVTRSGTNEIHGSAYEFYRDPATTSNNWFNKQAELNSGLPNIAAKVLEHTYGASLGVPIKKDKLFFFGAYEGFKQASDILVSQTVPSFFTGAGSPPSGLITGNVSYLAVCGTGVTTCATGQGTQTLTLTQSDIASMDGRASDPACEPPNPPSACTAPMTDQASIAYFKQFPAANSNATGDGLNTGTYNFTSPAPLDQITNIARIDWNINAKQQLFVRGNLQQDNSATAYQFEGLGQPPASLVYGNNKGIAAGHTWTISDSMTNNARYGLVRLGSATRGSANPSTPFVNFGAFNNLTPTTTSTVYIVTTNNFSDDFTYVKGHHTIQAGTNIYLISNLEQYDSNLVAQANVNPDLLATAGIANLGGTLDPGAFNCPDCATVSSDFQNFYNADIIANVGSIETASSGTDYAVKNNMLVPLDTSAAVPSHTYKNVEQEYYIQDQWKATPNLTLTAGLRYVYLGVPYEKNGQQIAPAISLNTFLANRAAAAADGTSYDTPVAFRASGSPNGQPNFWTPQKTNFAPRFAFAYATSNNKTSVRGGFALAYDHFGEGIIDAYESNPQSLFSLTQTNAAEFFDINSNPVFTGYNSVPPVPPAVAGNITLPYAPVGNPFTFDASINDHQKTPYAETFNLTFQHEFPGNFAVTASYVGRLGRHVLQNLDVAQPTNVYDSGSGQTYFQAATAYDKMIDAGVNPSVVPNSGYFAHIFPNASATDPVTGANYVGAQAYYSELYNGNRGNETGPLFNNDTNFLFFFPQTSSIYAQSTIGTSNYNALQLSVRQALRYGLEYDVNYTYAKSLDEGSDPEHVLYGSPIINTFGQSQMYAVSDFDVRHNLTANYTAPIPFGAGAPFLNKGGWMDRLVGGFQLNGVVHYSTGFPFGAVAAFTYGTNFAFSSNLVQTGPIPTGGHHYVASTQSETALKGITVAQAQANLRFAYVGDSGQRNNFRADGYFSLDDGLAKSFHIYKEHQLRLSVEVFNVLNTNRFNSLDDTQGGIQQNPLQTDGTSSNFGTYTGGPNALLLQPRQMQFSGKFIF